MRVVPVHESTTWWHNRLRVPVSERGLKGDWRGDGTIWIRSWLEVEWHISSNGASWSASEPEHWMFVVRIWLYQRW